MAEEVTVAEDIDLPWSMYFVHVYRVGNGWHLRLTMDWIPLVQRYCHPDAPDVRRWMAARVAGYCMSIDGRNLDDTMREAVRLAEERLADRLAALSVHPRPEVIRGLERDARGEVAQVLEEKGWQSAIERGWREHAVGRSECFQERLAAYREGVKEEAAEEGIRCGDWLQHFALCTSSSPEVARHVKFFPAGAGGEDLKLLEELLGSGITGCLGRIVEEDDAELARKASGLRARVAGKENMLEMTLRARELWRRRGVDRWFEEVKREGKVPEKLRLEILQCAGGYLPPVVEGQEKTTAPASGEQPRGKNGVAAPGDPAKR